MQSSKIFLRLSIFAGLLALFAFVAMPRTSTKNKTSEPSENKVQAVSQEALPAPGSFQAFLQRFPKAKFPIQIDEASLQKYSIPQNAAARAQRQKYTIEEQYETYAPFINEHKFSRMAAEGHYEYVALLSQEKDHIVVLCAQVYKSFDWEESMVMMISYNAQGEMLSTQRIASLNGFHGFETATIHKNLRVEIDKYEYQYKKNIEQHGYNNNPLLGKKLVESKYYQYIKSGEAPFLREIEEKQVQMSKI